MNYDELIILATDVGCLLLSNGGEIYRAEESMQRIFHAYGVKTGEVFASAELKNTFTLTNAKGSLTFLNRNIPCQTL